MDNYHELYTILEEFSYDANIKRIDFYDRCACLSDVTLDPCCLDVEVTVTQPFLCSYETQVKIEERIHEWANANLTWEGCAFCGHRLYVNCRLFSEKNYQEDWAIPKPIKKVLVNSRLFIGKDAVEILNTIVKEQPLAVLAHMASIKNRRRIFNIMVRKIDSYKDYIDLYTNVGILPLFVDTPTPVMRDIVEAIEVPNSYR